MIFRGGPSRIRNSIIGRRRISSPKRLSSVDDQMRKMTSNKGVADLALMTAVVVTLAGRSQAITAFTVNTYNRSDTNITAVPGDIPAHVSVIILEGNEISSIDSFGSFGLLDSLFLGRNALTEFPNVTSSGSRLRILRLNGNRIARIVIDRLDRLTALEQLDLSHNYLSFIPDIFALSETLTQLNLNDNNLSAFPFFRKMGRSLRILLLANNRIPLIPQQALQYLPSIMELDIDNNALNEFPDLTPVGACLQELHLSSNWIQHAPNDLLRRLETLTVLEMNRCGLLQIPDFRSSSSRTTLTVLGLSGNNIRSIPLSRLLPLGALMLISLSGNPLRQLPNLCHLAAPMKIRLPDESMVCDCHMRWLIYAELFHVRVLDRDLVRPCAVPSSLFGATWDEIRFENLTCKGYRMKQARPRRIGETFRCDLTDSKRWTRARSPLHCAAYCLELNGCHYFRFLDDARDEWTANCGQVRINRALASCGHLARQIALNISSD
ncbi:hypothetical protein LSH36_186g03004 [Paralvinella palmiformis]|uniref:Uncharacterized protein n=1 Tax=Paralvinella palmiformis TaxID=53620 RepID=A0AAD9JQV8_9ANNE|nr:hypothetical protein LSH36_186g03004 [Paralvinella palmiformis]